MRLCILLSLFISNFALAQNSHGDVAKLITEIAAKVKKLDGFNVSVRGVRGDGDLMFIEVDHPKLKYPVGVHFDFDENKKLTVIRPGNSNDSSGNIDVSHLAEQLEDFYKKAGSQLGPKKDFTQETLQEYSVAVDGLLYIIRYAFDVQFEAFALPDFKSRAGMFVRSWSYPVAVIVSTAIAGYYLNFESYAAYKTAVLGAYVFAASKVDPYIRKQARTWFEAERVSGQNMQKISRNVGATIRYTRSVMETHCARVLHDSYFK